jgi:hypothetical protein
LTLITTNYHRFDSDIEIEIWDLGLSPEQLRFLSLPLRQNLSLKSLVELGEEPFPNAFNTTIKSFVWKPFIIRKSLETTESLLWIDAGVAIANNLSPIFDDLKEKEFIFYKNNNYINLDFISDEASVALEIDVNELFAQQIHANILAFSRNDKTCALIDAWSYLMSKKEIATSEYACHRHDQTVLSFLISRMNLNISNSSGVIRESNEFQNAVTQGELFLAHRRTFNWIDYNSIIDL